MIPNYEHSKSLKWYLLIFQSALHIMFSELKRKPVEHKKVNLL